MRLKAGGRREAGPAARASLAVLDHKKLAQCHSLRETTAHSQGASMRLIQQSHDSIQRLPNPDDPPSLLAVQTQGDQR